MRRRYPTLSTVELASNRQTPFAPASARCRALSIADGMRDAVTA